MLSEGRKRGRQLLAGPPLAKLRFASATAQPDLKGLRPRAGRLGGKREEDGRGDFRFRLCWPILGLCWGHVDPSWRYAETMLTPLGPRLGHLDGYVAPPCCFNVFTSFPKFCLKKLPPVACKTPTPFLLHHFSQKPESCVGRAHHRGARKSSPQWP